MYDDLVERLRDSAKISEAIAVILPSSGGNPTAKLFSEAACAIDELSGRIALMAPAADARPVVRGQWIQDDLSGIIRCSRCGNDAPVDATGPTQYKSRFCQTCGADMRQEKEEEP